MENFLSAIPAAATSSYAFGAYAICAVLFIVGGAKLRELQSILKVIKDVPASQRAALIQTTTGRILPKHITAEQWIRHSRNQGFLSLGTGIIVTASAIIIIAMRNPGDPPLGKAPPLADAMEVTKSFLAHMDAGRYVDAWQGFYDWNKQSMPADRWVALSNTYRARLGKAEIRTDAGSTPSEIRLDRRLNGLLIMYYTKFGNAETPIAEQIGVTSPGEPVPWKVVSYTVAIPPNSPLLSPTPAAPPPPITSPHPP